MQAGIAQENARSIRDTLKLEDVFTNVLQNSPLIKESLENINSSELSVKLAKSAYLPTVDANAAYSKLAPIPTFDIPGVGNMQMYPNNNINLVLDAHQLIYDFGKTGNSVSMQEINRDMSYLSSEQLKQRLILVSSGIFYSLFYFQNATDIISEHLNTLTKNLKFIENKQITGSATQYEILSTQVKLSATETQLSEMQTAYDVQLSRLNTLMGLELQNIRISADTNDVYSFEFDDSSYVYALAHRNDILIMNKVQAMADMNYKLIQSQYYPTLGFFGTAGMKNGYLSDIEKLEPNYVVGLALRVPIFDGSRKNIKLNLAQSSINSMKYEYEHTARIAHDEISETYSQVQLSAKKVDQSKIQMQLAQKAYDHAEINFREGVITNLDLIYASDMLSDSKLQLLKNKVDFQFDLLKYRTALGEKIY
jgi:outer membrane protein